MFTYIITTVFFQFGRQKKSVLLCQTLHNSRLHECHIFASTKRFLSIRKYLRIEWESSEKHAHLRIEFCGCSKAYQWPAQLHSDSTRGHCNISRSLFKVAVTGSSSSEETILSNSFSNKNSCPKIFQVGPSSAGVKRNDLQSKQLSLAPNRICIVIATVTPEVSTSCDFAFFVGAFLWMHRFLVTTIVDETSYLWKFGRANRYKLENALTNVTKFSPKNIGKMNCAISCSGGTPIRESGQFIFINMK